MRFLAMIVGAAAAAERQSFLLSARDAAEDRLEGFMNPEALLGGVAQRRMGREAHFGGMFQSFANYEGGLVKNMLQREVELPILSGEIEKILRLRLNIEVDIAARLASTMQYVLSLPSSLLGRTAGQLVMLDSLMQLDRQSSLLVTFASIRPLDLVQGIVAEKAVALRSVFEMTLSVSQAMMELKDSFAGIAHSTMIALVKGILCAHPGERLKEVIGLYTLEVLQRLFFVSDTISQKLRMQLEISSMIVNLMYQMVHARIELTTAVVRFLASPLQPGTFLEVVHHKFISFEANASMSLKDVLLLPTPDATVETVLQDQLALSFSECPGGYPLFKQFMMRVVAVLEARQSIGFFVGPEMDPTEVILNGICQSAPTLSLMETCRVTEPLE